MSKQVLKQVSPLTSVWVDEEDKKQTSIDFLIEQIEIILKLNNVQLSAGYTIHTILPIIEKLKAMHKQEIEEAYDRKVIGDIQNWYIRNGKHYYELHYDRTRNDK